jgi:reductive dehalogenase
MKKVDEPTYKRFITKPLVRFDERNTVYSRADKGEFPSPGRVLERGLEKARKNVNGYLWEEWALTLAGRAIDSLVRQSAFSRDSMPRRWQIPVEPLSGLDPAKISETIKRVAKWFGADLVGISKLDRSWLYSNWGMHTAKLSQIAKEGDPLELPEGYQYVIAIAVEMDYKDVRRSPAVAPSTDLGYSKMAFVATSVAEYIRFLGYHSIPSGNDMGLSIAFGVDAGLGELGRNGLLITEEYGPRVRLCKVFTDMPLVPDKPIDLGVQHFCERCQRCARDCPAKAIPEGKRTDQPRNRSNNAGLSKWPLDSEKCINWWHANGTWCTNCVRVCPWNKPKGALHTLVRSITCSTSIFDSLFVRMDDALGYGKQVLEVTPSNR